MRLNEDFEKLRPNNEPENAPNTAASAMTEDGHSQRPIGTFEHDRAEPPAFQWRQSSWQTAQDARPLAQSGEKV